MSDHDDLLDDIDEIYKDANDMLGNVQKSAQDSQRTDEDAQIRLLEKQAELKIKQQQAEIEMAVKVLDFINIGKNHAREELKLYNEEMQENLEKTNKSIAHQKELISKITDSLRQQKTPD